MLNKVLAQNIVDRMMDIIHYNVNIMDKKGIIIASGQKERIGKVHEGAKNSLKTQNIVEVDCEKNNFKTTGVKCGVNIPITFNERIIGVIGVTGKPDKVRDFASLVKVTAELLINQEYSIQKFVIKNKLKEEFLAEWLYKRETYDADFVERGKSLNIDVKKSHYIYLIEYAKKKECVLDRKIKNILENEDYIIHINENKVVVILSRENRSKLSFILKEKYSEDICRVVNSEFKENLASEFYLMNIAIINAEKIDFYKKFISEKNDINFLASIEEYLHKSDSCEILNKIMDAGEDILETFLVFSKVNFEKVTAAKLLHIHRNTLGYRLAKIETITGLNYDYTIDKFRLLSAYLNYKITSQNNKK